MSKRSNVGTKDNNDVNSEEFNALQKNDSGRVKDILLAICNSPKSDNRNENLIAALDDLLLLIVETRRRVTKLLVLEVVCVIKTTPDAFAEPCIVENFVKLLRRASNAKVTKSVGGISQSRNCENLPEDITIQCFLCNILEIILHESTSWPVSLISAFLEDSLLHRTWTDDPLCTNVVQAVLIGIGANVGAIKGTMQTVTKFNDSEKMVELRSQILKSIEDKVKQLTSKCSIASSSNIGEMKRLASCLEQLSTIPEVRYLACRSIAFLLQIPTLKTLGKKLLSSICQHTDSLCDSDIEIVTMLLRLKLKSALWQTQIDAIIRICQNQPKYLKIALSYFISNEKPNNMGKSADNMKAFILVFQNSNPQNNDSEPSNATTSFTIRSKSSQKMFNLLPKVNKTRSILLAEVFKDLAMNADYVLSLCTIAKKILKNVPISSFDFASFGLSLLTVPVEFESFPIAKKGNWLKTISGLLVQTMYTAMNTTFDSKNNIIASTSVENVPAQIVSSGSRRLVKEGHVGQSLPSTDRHAATENCDPINRSNPELNIRITIALFQEQALIWLMDKWSPLLKHSISDIELSTAVSTIVLTQDCIDFQNSEIDDAVYTLATKAVPLFGGTIESIIQLCSKAHVISPKVAVGFLSTMIDRGIEFFFLHEANLLLHQEGACKMDDEDSNLSIGAPLAETIDAIFRLTEAAPCAEIATRFYSRDLTCQVLQIVLLLAAFHPETTGKVLWYQFPTARSLIQMCISGCWNFPAACLQDAILLGKQEYTIMTNQILVARNSDLEHLEREFSKLAGEAVLATDPRDIARSLPENVVNIFRVNCARLALGQKFRGCRSPDFLSEMVEMDSALPSGGFEWIAKAVSSDVGTLHHLSPHRLNELALNVIGGVADESICTNIRASYQSLLPKIIARIQDFIALQKDEEQALNVMLHLFEGLRSKSSKKRLVTTQLLCVVFSDNISAIDKPEALLHHFIIPGDFSWLRSISKKAYFHKIKSQLLNILDVILGTECSVEVVHSCVVSMIFVWLPEMKVSNSQTCTRSDIISAELFILSLSKLLVNRLRLSTMILNIDFLWKDMLQIYIAYFKLVVDMQHNPSKMDTDDMYYMPHVIGVASTLLLGQSFHDSMQQRIEFGKLMNEVTYHNVSGTIQKLDSLVASCAKSYQQNLLQNEIFDIAQQVLGMDSTANSLKGCTKSIEAQRTMTHGTPFSQIQQCFGQFQMQSVNDWTSSINVWLSSNLLPISADSQDGFNFGCKNLKLYLEGYHHIAEEGAGSSRTTTLRKSSLFQWLQTNCIASINSFPRTGLQSKDSSGNDVEIIFPQMTIPQAIAVPTANFLNYKVQNCIADNLNLLPKCYWNRFSIHSISKKLACDADVKLTYFEEVEPSLLTTFIENILLFRGERSINQQTVQNSILKVDSNPASILSIAYKVAALNVTVGLFEQEKAASLFLSLFDTAPLDVQ